MELTIISLVVSGVLAATQVLTYIEDRKVKGANKLNVFSKAADVEKELISIRSDTELQFKALDNQAEKIQKMETTQAVLVERVDNEEKDLEKIERKLDNILERL